MTELRPDNGTPEDKPPRGFVSAEAKRKLITLAAVLVGLSAFIEIGGSIGLSLYGIMKSGFGEMRQIEPDRGAWWKNGLWLVETEMGRRYGVPLETRLLRWTDGGDGELVEMASFNAQDPHLLPADDTLWIVSPEMVGKVSAAGIEFAPAKEWLGIISPPFLSAGRPAVIADGPDGRALWRFEDREWRSKGIVNLGADATFAELHSVLVIGDIGQESVIAFSDGELRATPEGARCLEAGGCPDRWETVLDTEDNLVSYSAVAPDGQPMVFGTLSQGIKGELVGYRRGAVGWERFIELELGLPGAVGVFATDKPGRLLLVCQGFPGSLSGWQIVAGEVRGKLELGEKPPLPTGGYGGAYGASAISAVLMFIVALILSPRMRRQKTRVHQVDGKATAYASLVRRGLALAIDSLIMGGPLIISLGAFMGLLIDLETSPMGGILDLVGLFAIGSLWATIVYFVFSYIEGRSGKTPGKWLLRIRTLNRDLEPCGFGRALLRNILMIVDGIFSAGIGVLMIVITPNWQRLGDLASKTVVVMDSFARPGPAASNKG